MLTMKELRKLVDEQIRLFYVDANRNIISPKEDRRVLKIVKTNSNAMKVLVDL